ncbi:MAG: efflux RND transporter periplasmic adaptor subunit [Desulfobacterales bacterium]
MKKKIFFTIIGLILVIGGIGGIKGLQIGKMIAQGQSFSPPPETVSTAAVTRQSWEILRTSVGSLTAVQGVTLTAELTGKITEIAFESGTRVEAGDLLLRQDTSSEEAQLRAADAAVVLAKANFERAKRVLSQKAISETEFDSAKARYASALAEADGIRAVIAKKTIRAPFSGRLGIRMVNLGQIINQGEAIVSLQTINPIFVNFLLPQHQLADIHAGLTVRITADALSDQAEGTITAINPEVDTATRNIRIQATAENPQEQLRPGMFVNVAVVLPEQKPVLSIPATAVLYAPYSDSVFVVEEANGEKKDSPGKVIRQQFVRIGEKRGDFLAIVSGLKEGDTVVSTGVFKLRNGQSVVVDNTLNPEFRLDPNPEDS